MIEKMKVVHIVTTAAEKTALLDRLQQLGIVHFSEKAAADQQHLQRFADLSRMDTVLQEYGDVPPEKAPLSDNEFEIFFSELSTCMERKKALQEEQTAAHAAAERLAEWGRFSPAEVRSLKDAGWDIHIYRTDKKTMAALLNAPDVQVIRLSPVGKMQTFATLSPLPGEYSATEFPIPDKGLEELEQEQQRCAQELADCEVTLRQAASHLPSIHAQMLKTQNDAEYSAVSNTSQSQDGLVWLRGYLPAAQVEDFKTAAAQAHWAWALEDPDADDDQVPTKVKYNKVTKLMIPVFDILGTVPGYREYDISFWFLGFFTLFFAMIIGDAGYGCLFLLLALVLTLKGKKKSNAVQLLWVLSIATIIWGALTGTWFGLEQAMDVPLLRSLVIPTFANYPAYFDVSTTTQQNTIMKFCFILGTVQLSLACVMNIRRKLKEKDLSWVADLGWLAAIDALYFVVLYLVIGQEVNLIPVACVVIAGFLLVVFFGGMAPDKTFAQGLKAGLGDAFTVFLNTISAFGNIISYIRLFAVGMASLAIAQSFNNLAFGFKGPLVVAAVLILLIGHGLNIVMGLLSVVVHGVRLNLLEFSGQLGMEWAGIAYDPFKKGDKIKK